MHGCASVVLVDDAEVPSDMQVQTLPSQSVKHVYFAPQSSESQLCDLREVFADFQSLLADRPGCPVDA